MTISDGERFLGDELHFAPNQFMAESVDDVFALMRSVTGHSRNQLYARLVTSAESLAVGSKALSKLPASRQRLLTAEPRAKVIAFPRSIVQTFDLQRQLIGAADLQITISKHPERSAVGPAITPPVAQPAQPPATEMPGIDGPGMGRRVELAARQCADGRFASFC